MTIGVRALAASLFCIGFGLAAACSSSSPPGDGAAGSSGSDEDAGAGGKSGSGSKGGAAGRAGSGNKAGTTGKAGSTSAGDGGAAGETGEGGEGGTDPCAACASGACLPDGTCVDCTTTKDVCPDGHYCGAENTCLVGCKNGDACASGVCNAQHDCQSCLSDQECSDVHVCGNNVCAAACTVAQEGTSDGCGAGLTCCGLHCIDAKTDSAHCGACGTACATGEFCGTTGCQASTLKGVCSVAKLALVLDGQAGNAAPGRVMAQALVAQCPTVPALREISQDVADVVNTKSGQPVAGGDELLIAPGGGFFAHLTGYVSDERVAPLYATQNLTTKRNEFRLGKTDAVVVSADYNAPHAGHDFFIVQFVRDPASGSLVLNAQGFWQEGTTAAAFYFAKSMLPLLATLDQAWYAYEWTDANADQLPDANDTFKLVDSGN